MFASIVFAFTSVTSILVTCISTGYPWSNISTSEDCDSVLSRQNRWLFLPVEIRVILNKNYLYGNGIDNILNSSHNFLSIADLFAYILMCQQMKNFVRNPIHSIWPSSNGGHASMFELNHIVDYFKVSTDSALETQLPNHRIHKSYCSKPFLLRVQILWFVIAHYHWQLHCILPCFHNYTS